MTNERYAASRRIVVGSCLFAIAAFICGGLLHLASEDLNEERWQLYLGLGQFLLGVGVVSFGLSCLVAVTTFISRVAASDLAKDAVQAVRRTAHEVGKPRITTTSGMSTADELEKWARLRDTGVVSEDEFQTARDELLKAPRS